MKKLKKCGSFEIIHHPDDTDYLLRQKDIEGGNEINQKSIEEAKEETEILLKSSKLEFDINNREHSYKFAY